MVQSKKNKNSENGNLTTQNLKLPLNNVET